MKKNKLLILMIIACIILIIICINLFTKKGENNDNSNNKNNSEYSSYIGVWHFPDNTYPEQEIIIKKIENNKVFFDYIIDGIIDYENLTAELDNNIARFDIKEKKDWQIKGKITLENDNITLEIEESENEYIVENIYTYTIKTNKSILQGKEY